MSWEIVETLLADELTMMLIVSGFSFLAVWVPFFRGLKIGFRGLAATRRLAAKELGRALKGESRRRVEPVAVLLLRVLSKSLRETQRDSTPSEFVIDATRQYVMNEYDAHYQRPITMYAGILPPIGFIGTTAGLMILFVSMRMASDALELGALAMALTSSIFALIAFAVLEALKIRLYARLLAALSDALAFHRSALERADARQPSARARTAAASAS